MNKTKFILSLALLFGCVGFAGAQTQEVIDNASLAFDFSQYYNEGTARTLGMGNAFTALGGDLGALSIQPAASAVFGHSEMTFTPSLNFSSSTTNYLSTNTNSKHTDFSLSNFAAVFNLSNTNLNFAIGVNKVRDFYGVMAAHGTTNQTSWLGAQAAGLSGYNSSNLTDKSHDPYSDGVSWGGILAWDAYLLSTLPDSQVDYLASTENIDEATKTITTGGPLDQDLYRRTDGGVYEIELNMGGNVNDILYWGANLNIQTLQYNVYQTYSETAQKVADFQDGFDTFLTEYDESTTGTGVNFKLGAIYRPTDNLRIGAALQTPTWFSLNDQYRTYIQSSFYDANGNNKKYGYNNDDAIYTPLGNYNYRMTTPFRANLGLAYTFGSYALISADYDFANYRHTTLGVYGSDASSDDRNFYNTVNSYMANNFAIVHGFRAGLEVKPVQSFALRAGYQNYGYAGSNSGYTILQSLLSFGLGLNIGQSLYLDCAYQRKLNTAENSSFWCYSDYGGMSAPEGKMTKTGKDKLLFTLGFRF